VRSAAQHVSPGSRARLAVGLVLIASGAAGVALGLAIFAPVPAWLYVLGSGVGSVPGIPFMVPVCGALLTLVDRPWRARAGWAGVVYGVLVGVATASMTFGIPWSKDAVDAFLLLGIYAMLPLDIAVFVLSIATGVALLRTKEEPGGIAVRRLSARLMVFALMLSWPR
jgi:hypothetical protein